MISLLIVLCSIYVLSTIHKKLFKESFLLIFKDKIDMKKSIIYSFIFSLTFVIIVLILDKLSLINIVSSYNASNKSIILGIFNSVLVYPVVEEYLFRYLPLRLFKNNHLAIIISSIIFTLLHSTFGLMYLVVFMSSLALFYIYKKTNNIKYCIISHSIYNLLIILFGLIELL